MLLLVVVVGIQVQPELALGSRDPGPRLTLDLQRKVVLLFRGRAWLGECQACFGLIQRVAQLVDAVLERQFLLRGCEMGAGRWLSVG
jgi:hypothetical protein